MFAIKQEILAAEQRISNFVRTTPLEYSYSLSKSINSHVYLKCENMQYTGAFKVRGAFNKLLSLTEEEKKQGVVTASSGNHGAAVAYGLKKLKLTGVVFVPENAAETKVNNIKSLGAKLEKHFKEVMKTELYAKDYAKKHKMIYIPPYNDEKVIAGQGTIGLELVHQLDKIDAILVPVGGGGLISGIAGYLKSVSPGTQIIGCLPANSPTMAASIKAGKIIEVEMSPTLSDATKGGIVANSITFELCKKYVDDFILVSEEEIKGAIKTAIQSLHCLIEGAAAVALAALLKNKKWFKNKNVVVILSGANISVNKLKETLC